MHYLYIIKNSKHKNYTGVAENIEQRLYDHNLRRVKSTKYGRPWNLVYTETFATLSEAKKREWFLKCTPQGQKLKKKILETAGMAAHRA